MAKQKLQFTIDVPVYDWQAASRDLPAWYTSGTQEMRDRYGAEMEAHRDPVTGMNTCAPDTCGKYLRRHWREVFSHNAPATVEMEIDLQSIAQDLGRRANRTKSGKATGQGGDIKVKIVRVR